MTSSHDFLDNLANHQHQKMLREISNDHLTPKKRDKMVQSEIFGDFEGDFEEDGLDYDMDSIPLAEF